MSAEQEVAALRLMLRETARTNATGIDYALRCQRERDKARAEAEEAARAYNDVAADLRKTAAELAAAQRELHRLTHGADIEGDGACEHEIHADAARAWARLWHREARRLWREVQDLNALLSEEHREVMRLRSVIRRYLRTNPPQVEALRDLLFRSAAGEDIDADRGVASTRAAEQTAMLALAHARRRVLETGYGHDALDAARRAVDAVADAMLTDGSVKARSEALTRAAALREAADIARSHGGISAYYALHKLAAEVEP